MHFEKIAHSLLLAALLSITPALALDIVIIDKPVSADDRRNEYTDKLLLEVLTKTEKKYGAYDLHHAAYPMERQRMLVEMKKGALINVSAQPSQPAWEKELLPIWIPVDKGLSSYRIFLINEQSQKPFSKIRTLDELKKLRLGVENSWASYKVYAAAGFNIVAGTNYEGLFSMLASMRFDYFPRALYEAFSEAADRRRKFPELAIEKSVVLYFPLPKYFFVSPAQPRLAKRIREGMEIMIKDGSLDQLFFEQHRAIIDQTAFCKRRLLSFDNPLIAPETPLKRVDLWFNPYKASRGKAALCK